MLNFPKKISPTWRSEEGLCPCRLPHVITLWEANVFLCHRHAIEWLRSEEKKAAVAAIEKDDPAALLAAVDQFVDRIRRRPGFFTRLAIRQGPGRHGAEHEASDRGVTFPGVR